MIFPKNKIFIKKLDIVLGKFLGGFISFDFYDLPKIIVCGTSFMVYGNLLIWYVLL